MTQEQINEQVIKLNLTIAEINFILSAISKLPLENGYILFNKIKNTAEDEVKSLIPNTAE